MNMEMSKGAAPAPRCDAEPGVQLQRERGPSESGRLAYRVRGLVVR